MSDDERNLPPSPFDGYDDLFSIPQLIGFFVLAVPSSAILQAWGLGWNGVVVCVTGSALLMAFAKPLYGIAKERIPALQSGLPSWQTLLMPVTYHENGERTIEGTLAKAEDRAKPEEDTHSSDEPINDEEVLHLGATLTLHADQLLSKRIGMFGIPGSGKSNGVAVFCEELGKLSGIGVPFVLADTEGEYDPICTPVYLMRPFKATALNVTPENAHQFGERVLDEGLQVVLNLQSYATDDIAALVMIGIIHGMRAYAEAKENADRATCMFILDEAAIWLPQNQGESVLSKEKDERGQTMLAKLQQAFFGTVVRRGRKRGIGFLFATQRIADIDKRCISCDWLILFRQTLTNDLARYSEMGIAKDTAQALAPGEAFVLDPQGNKRLHQLRKRYSPDRSQTPGLASLKKYARQWTGGNDERLPHPPPTSSAFEHEEETEEVQQTIVLGKNCSLTLREFSLAVQLRVRETVTGYRGYMEYFGLTEHYAKELNKRVDAHLREAERNGVSE
jgi:hypothetical protein